MEKNILFFTLWFCFGFINKYNIPEMMEKGRLLFQVDLVAAVST